AWGLMPAAPLPHSRGHPNGPPTPIRDHGPKLQHHKRSAVLTHPLLTKQHRPRRVEPDGQGDQGQQWRNGNEYGTRDQDVEPPFDNERTRAAWRSFDHAV